jgi:hypothetical protein
MESNLVALLGTFLDEQADLIKRQSTKLKEFVAAAGGSDAFAAGASLVDDGKKKKKKKKDVDPNAPKHPPSAYILFMANELAPYKASHQDMAQKEIMKDLGNKWSHEISDRVKEEYRAKAEALKLQYNADLEAYVHRKNLHNGESSIQPQEEESESSDSEDSDDEASGSTTSDDDHFVQPKPTKPTSKPAAKPTKAAPSQPVAKPPVVARTVTAQTSVGSVKPKSEAKALVPAAEKSKSQKPATKAPAPAPVPAPAPAAPVASPVKSTSSVKISTPAKSSDVSTEQDKKKKDKKDRKRELDADSPATPMKTDGSASEKKKVN